MGRCKLLRITYLQEKGASFSIRLQLFPMNSVYISFTGASLVAFLNGNSENLFEKER